MNSAQIAFWNSSANIQKFPTCSMDSATCSPPSSPPISPNVHPETQLVISPITADVKKPAHRDYAEQQRRINSGLPLVWDDSKHNKSAVGDKFGFWFYRDKVHIHTIIGVSSPQHRLPSWSDNVGQNDRNVVTLSKDFIVIPWEKWIELDGARRCMGTVHVKKGLLNILNFR